MNKIDNIINNIIGKNKQLQNDRKSKDATKQEVQSYAKHLTYIQPNLKYKIFTNNKKTYKLQLYPNKDDTKSEPRQLENVFNKETPINLKKDITKIGFNRLNEQTLPKYMNIWIKKDILPTPIITHQPQIPQQQHITKQHIDEILPQKRQDEQQQRMKSYYKWKEKQNEQRMEGYHKWKKPQNDEQSKSKLNTKIISIHPVKTQTIASKSVLYYNHNSTPKVKTIQKVYKKIPDNTNIPLMFMTRKQYLNQYIKNQENKNGVKFTSSEKKEYVKKEMPQYRHIIGRYTTKQNEYFPPAVVVFNDKDNKQYINGKCFGGFAWHEFGHEKAEKQHLGLNRDSEEIYADKIAYDKTSHNLTDENPNEIESYLRRAGPTRQMAEKTRYPITEENIASINLVDDIALYLSQKYRISVDDARMLIDEASAYNVSSRDDIIYVIETELLPKFLKGE